MRRTVPALVAVTAIGGVLAPAGPAVADGSLAPGGSRQVVVEVPHWAAEAVEVDVTVTGLVDLESGCLEPEREAGDDCSSELGELADRLEATVTWGVSGDEEGTCQAAVVPASLVLEPGSTTEFTDVAAVECVVVTLAFPDAGVQDNLAQSDTLDLALGLVARGLAEETGTDGTGLDATDADRTDSDAADAGGAVTTGQQAADATSGRPAGTGGDRDGTFPAAGGAAAGPGAGAPGGEPSPVVGPEPTGPVLDRVDARVSVDGRGVAVQTQAADTTSRGLVLAWGSVLLGAVALGWVGFVLVVRRRHRRAAA